MTRAGTRKRIYDFLFHGLIKAALSLSFRAGEYIMLPNAGNLKTKIMKNE